MNTQPRPDETTHGLFWVADPSHAWLAVDLTAFPDARDYGTGYGYKHGAFIYLEEDLEAPAFLEDHPGLAAHHRAGDLAVRRYDFDAPCRRYNHNEERLDVEAYLERRRQAREEANA